nr:hypothetical protein [Tanacetum cinerariifolium]
DRSIMSDQLNLLRRDRRFHARMTILIKSEARASREAWVQSIDASDKARYETQMVALQSQQRHARDLAHPDIPEEADAEIRRDPDREIGYKIIDVWEDPDEIVKEIPATDMAELGQRMIDFVTTVRQDTNEIYSEARASREAWVQSIDASDKARYE